MMSSSGASPATVGSAMPPRSICPARSTRSSSGPVRLRSGQLARVTEMRPPAALAAVPRAASGCRRGCIAGWSARAASPSVIATGGPAGSSCASAAPDVSASAAPRKIRFMCPPFGPCPMQSSARSSGISPLPLGKGAAVVSFRPSGARAGIHNHKRLGSSHRLCLLGIPGSGLQPAPE